MTKDVKITKGYQNRVRLVAKSRLKQNVQNRLFRLFSHLRLFDYLSRKPAACAMDCFPA